MTPASATTGLRGHLSSSRSTVVLQSLEDKTILLTGAAGFLGTAIAEHLAGVRCRVRRLDRPDVRRARPHGHARWEDIDGDVADRTTWHDALADADVVIHLAAQTSVYVAEADPVADLRANVEPMLSLIDACRARRTRPVVAFAGTATEVGLTDTGDPVDESRQDVPITVYDVHKLTAERHLACATRLGDVQGVTLRLTNVYGPGPRSSNRDRGFLNAMVRRALAGEPLTAYGSGACVRDYVYVDDVVRAFLTAIVNIHRVEGRHFLVGSGTGTTIAGALRLVADRVAAQTGVHVPVLSVETPAGLSPIERRSFVADTRRLRDATGWEAQVDLAQGIDRTIAAARVS